jgi:hypothetical protein
MNKVSFELQKLEESDYGLEVDLLTVLFLSHVSYPRRSGLVEKSNHLRPIYLGSLTDCEAKNESGLPIYMPKRR